MIIDFFKLMNLSDYMFLIAAMIMLGLYIYHFIKPRIDRYYSFILKPKRESDAFISTLSYHLKNKEGLGGRYDARTKNIRTISIK